MPADVDQADTPDYRLRLDRFHACPVPFKDPETAAVGRWRCPECGRWWKRTWELAGDQPPVDEELLLRRAGIGPGEAIELRRHQIVAAEEDGLDYLIWAPAGDPGTRGWPLIIYLHGGAETGGHPSNAARGGLPKEIELGFSPPFVVVSPHCPNPPHPNRNSWAEYRDEVIDIVGQVRAKHPIDENAILLTGPSMGGYGAWDIAAHYPEAFTAIAPVCGGGDPLLAESLARNPICVLHGEVDTIVPVERSLEMIKEVRARGGQVRAVIYPDTEHVDAMVRTYSPESELYEWFRSTTTL